MKSPSRDAGLEPLVKCSSCATDIELSAIAEHVCQQLAPSPQSQPFYDRVAMQPNHVQYEPHAPRAVSPLRAQRPVLPKLDSSMAGRHGLRPGEAASIAHDLGLPSPLSAGSSSSRPHRSRSRSKKTAAARPPSPDAPISQDCAFPPFPMKPKRDYGEREIKTRKPHSTSRSTNSVRTHNHSSNPSNASSVYSNASGPRKSRTSNASSSLRSRQGTMDDTMSLPSTAPSSPRQSVQSPIDKEQSRDNTLRLPALVSSDSYSYSEPNSSASTMPPTPSWLSEAREPSPRILQSSGSDAGWTPTESTIPEENFSEMEAHVPKKTVDNQPVVVEQVKVSDQLNTNADVFDNPPREPLYKTRRPPPLLPVQPQVPIDPVMPLSARAPPPPPSQSTGSLTRTLTNLFGRKRSHTSGPKTMPLPSFDSPRMRALAPDPPERPMRGENLWDDAASASELVGSLPHPTTAHDNDSLQARDDPSVGQDVPVVQHARQNREDSQNSPENSKFDFGLGDEHPADHVVQKQSEWSLGDGRQDRSVQIPELTYSTTHLERDSRRESIDSASSYGSIGFSTNRTASSRSDAPTSDDVGLKVSTAPHTEQQSTQSFELNPYATTPAEDLTPESPTDPLYSAGKLSPVPESSLWEGSQAPERERSPPRSLASLAHDLHHRAASKSSRPETPAAIKGRCRGCSDLIVTGQKSLASADGRLTGRYHKECFVCQTCQEPFATADFYVYDDHPYCAHHYHELNDTLCIGCGKGIEGQYLETSDAAGSSSKKFHSKCLQCATCKMQLHDDYFEFQGRVYCERDAFRAANGPVRNPYDTVPSRPSPLIREYINSEEPGLKGRFPERRTTRLIMT